MAAIIPGQTDKIKMRHQLHAVRDANGALISIANEPQAGSEMLDARDPEILAFLNREPERNEFNGSDAQFVRVLEDLIDTLIEQGVIRHTDLPKAAQQKLLSRKGLRQNLKGALNPLVDDHGLV
jgi:hypothetical protein